MTAFLMFNGIEVPVTPRTFEFTPKNIGSQERGAGVGEMRDAMVGQKSEGGGVMPFVPPLEGDAWEGIITGAGVRWSFDESLVSDFGVPPSTGGSAVLGSTAPAAKFGAARVLVPSATTLVYSFNVASSNTNWSVMFWYWNGASWDHYMLCSDATKFKNGATLGTALGIVAVTMATTTVDGVVSVVFTLKGRNVADSANADAYFDEVVFLPYLMTSTLLALHYAAGVTWGRSRRINISGNAIPAGQTLEAYGEITSRKLDSANWGGVFYNNLRSLSFMLRQR